MIELAIYTAIIGLMLAAAAGFLWNIVFGNIKEAAYQETQQNARFLMTKIIQEAKKATGVNFLAAGDASTSLSLAMATPDLNPTIFDLDNGRLRIKRGGLAPSYLNSENTLISDLLFTNLSRQDKPSAIRIEMTIEYLNPQDLPVYRASVGLQSTVVLLPGGAPVLPSYLSQLRYRWRNDDGGE